MDELTNLLERYRAAAAGGGGAPDAAALARAQAQQAAAARVAQQVAAIQQLKAQQAVQGAAAAARTTTGSRPASMRPYGAAPEAQDDEEAQAVNDVNEVGASGAGRQDWGAPQIGRRARAPQTRPNAMGPTPGVGHCAPRAGRGRRRTASRRAPPRA
jgi:hypothetical protein